MIKRGTFVSLAASAAVGTTIAPARAQTMLVSENDPAIAVTNVELESGGKLPAYAASPRTADESTPGVVVVMHVWGVDDSIREVVRAFAKKGFAAVAPDFYAPFHAPSGDGQTDYTVFAPYAQKLQPDAVDGGVRSAALWLKQQHPKGKAGVTGFCMGGAIALRQAVGNADVLSADAVWYGKVAGVDPASVRIPLLGSYGERDTSIPAQSVREFEDGLTVAHDFAIYPGAGHAFFDRTRSSYVQAAATDSWRRTLNFFTKHLGSE